MPAVKSRPIRLMLAGGSNGSFYGDKRKPIDFGWTR